MKKQDTQFNLRVAPELKQRIEDAAQISKRSINAEAEFRLQSSFAVDENVKIISALLQRIDALEQAAKNEH